jgi:hypothetical protein
MLPSAFKLEELNFGNFDCCKQRKEKQKQIRGREGERKRRE